MNLILRLVIGFILAAIVFAVVLNRLHVPPDRYMPAPMAYANTNKTASGVVTKVEDEAYTEHWWAGGDHEYYIDYSFQPVLQITEPSGKTEPELGPYYSAAVRIEEADYYRWVDRIKSDGRPPVEVIYDQKNPAISEVPRTLGVFNRSSGYFGIWLVYLLGLAILAVIFQELLKRWIPSE